MKREVDTIHKNIAFSNVTKENLINIFTKSQNALQSIKGINQIIDTQNEKILVIKGTITRTAKISANTTSATQEVTASSENQLVAVTNVFNSISRLTDMNKRLKDKIASFAQNYNMTAETQKYIYDGLETLKTLANQTSLSSMNYHICTSILNDNINNHPHFELFGLVDKKGLRKAITLDYKEDEVYTDFSHRPYFKEAIKGNEYKSKPYISVDTNNYCIAIAVPVKDSFGEIAGVLMGDLILG
jgi:methyl-accepting chemotaxis protein